jgi:uncharacterized protein YceK
MALRPRKASAAFMVSLVVLAGCRSILGLDSGGDGTADLDAATDETGATPANGADGSSAVTTDSGQTQGGNADGSGDGGGKDGSTVDARTPDANRNVDRAWAAWPLPPVSLPDVNYDMKTDTVLDHTTLLVWQRNVDPTKRVWADAKAYCDGLVLAGESDWRLPTRIELWSIIDFGAHGPSINQMAFPGTPVDYFWSLSLDAQNSAMNPTYKAWVVSFDDGTAGPAVSAMYSLPVRCVRGG